MTQLVDKLQSIEAMKTASKGKTEAAYGGQEKPGMAIDCYDNPKSRNYKGKEAASDGEGWQQRKGFGGTCDFCGRREAEAGFLRDGFYAEAVSNGWV
ncbi:hypothetical protein CLOM_g9268 [Closterium sp. NIES-68]|nr:hypothetical protein CLOM_g9268 [Closterium sp. NIES-68]